MAFSIANAPPGLLPLGPIHPIPSTASGQSGQSGQSVRTLRPAKHGRRDAFAKHPCQVYPTEGAPAGRGSVSEEPTTRPEPNLTFVTNVPVCITRHCAVPALSGLEDLLK